MGVEHVCGEEKKRKDRLLPDLVSSDYGQLLRAIAHLEDRNHLEEFKGRDKENYRLWQRHCARKEQSFLVFIKILNGGIKAPLSNKDIFQQIPLF
jgi:hypothetical protein